MPKGKDKANIIINDDLIYYSWEQKCAVSGCPSFIKLNSKDWSMLFATTMLKHNHPLIGNADKELLAKQTILNEFINLFSHVSLSPSISVQELKNVIEQITQDYNLMIDDGDALDKQYVNELLQLDMYEHSYNGQENSQLTMSTQKSSEIETPKTKDRVSTKVIKEELPEIKEVKTVENGNKNSCDDLENVKISIKSSKKSTKPKFLEVANTQSSGPLSKKMNTGGTICQQDFGKGSLRKKNNQECENAKTDIEKKKSFFDLQLIDQEHYLFKLMNLSDLVIEKIKEKNYKIEVADLKEIKISDVFREKEYFDIIDKHFAQNAHKKFVSLLRLKIDTDWICQKFDKIFSDKQTTDENVQCSGCLICHHQSCVNYVKDSYKKVWFCEFC